MKVNASREVEISYAKKLNDSDEYEVEDNLRKDLVGQEAVKDYFDHYKNLTKIQQQNLFFKLQRRQEGGGRLPTSTALPNFSLRNKQHPCRQNS